MRREVIDIMSQLVSVRCKAVLFDMDGTLVDSTQVVELDGEGGRRDTTYLLKMCCRSHTGVRR